MGETTMLELLEKVANTVKDYWVEGEKGQIHMEDSKKPIYADKIKELMDKAVFGDEEMKWHTGKDIALKIDVSESTFSRFKNGARNIKPDTLKEVLNYILKRLNIEENLADDEMKERVCELLFRIFRREEVKGITKHFSNLPENIDDVLAQASTMYCHELQIGYIFGNPEQTQDISYGDYFIDGRIIEDFYIGPEMLFKEYRTGDGSKRYVVIFDVKEIYDREYLHQRIRCLQRKDNVFAVLMVEKGELCDDENFYRDERNNIMWIRYKKVCEENSEICSCDYLEGICLSWYDEKCKALMTEGIDKIIGSQK